MLADLFGGEVGDHIIDGVASSRALTQEPFKGLGDLFSPAIAHGNLKVHPIRVFGHGRHPTDGGTQGVREVHLGPDGFNRQVRSAFGSLVTYPIHRLINDANQGF